MANTIDLAASEAKILDALFVDLKISPELNFSVNSGEADPL